MQITDDIILKYSGSLLEIYTANTDSFSVGSIALYSNSEILFRIYDELGREVALYLVKREHINNIIANTEYLKKMDLYCEYWKGENINKSTYFLEYMSNLLFEKVKSALVWILLILNTMINSLDFTNSKDCFYSYGLY